MRVLFVGNSHTFFNDMPALFASMCAELTGERPEVTMLAYPGRSLEWHCQEYFPLRFALLYGGYDFCVLQQQAHPFPGEETTVRFTKRIVSLCRNVGVKPVIFMTWAEKAKPENFAVMERVYTSLAAETGALLAPVGRVFARMRRERPDVELYFKDGEHASPAGDYLIASLLAGLLCGRDIGGLSDDAIDFGIRLEEGSFSTLENAAACRTALDHAQAAAIRGFVSQALKEAGA